MRIARLLCLVTLATPMTLVAQGTIIPRPCPENRCPIPVAGVIQRTSSQVRVELADRVLRYQITETFRNRGGLIGEADYLFPMPAGAAFEALELEIDGELVSGETMPAERARQIYEDIVRRNRDPALVEYMGRGLLRTRIFPIQPGEEKRVVVRFQSVAEREGSALRVDYLRSSQPRTETFPIPRPRPVPLPAPRDGRVDDDAVAAQTDRRAAAGRVREPLHARLRRTRRLRPALLADARAAGERSWRAPGGVGVRRRAAGHHPAAPAPDVRRIGRDAAVRARPRGWLRAHHRHPARDRRAHDAARPHLRRRCLRIHAWPEDGAGPRRRPADARVARRPGPVSYHRLLHRCPHVPQRLHARDPCQHRRGEPVSRRSPSGRFDEHLRCARGGARCDRR